MTLEQSTRDGEIEAFVVDRYLESLLARTPRDPTDVPADLRTTADALAALPRYHPSFRFVEALSARLAATASGQDASGELVAFRVIDRAVAADPRAQVRPVVIGGVLTSAAISLAGAAYVAWR
ncbi:MAG TPA: hypothetical protein VFN41_05035, partial [Candidatus Limnocylindrales bacterium]|nr:hypothetical protein [Candidatus Limnocylindrales bacterium]